jgi:tripartite-type tricarboxylate transporter receptor subunit TctC
MTKKKGGQPALQAQETEVKTITRNAALKNKNGQSSLTGAFALSLVGFAIALGSGSAARAQTADWPTKPVRIIVPYSPGGGTDIISRRLAQGLGPVLKQNVIVENKPGANGIIGTDIVAKSEPDGHTYVVVVSTHLINPLVTKNMPYDTFKDLIGVTVVADSPLIFVTSSQFPAKTMEEFTKAMRAKTGTYSYGSSENMTKLVGAMYANAEKLDMVSVSYKGGAPLMTDVVSGVTTVGITSILTARNFMDSGRLTPLAVTSAQRSAAVPNVPTMREAGVKDFEITQSYAMYAPSKTPKAILNAMQKAVHQVAMSPDMKAALADQAAWPVAQPVDEFNERIKKEAAFLQDLAKRINLQGD